MGLKQSIVIRNEYTNNARSEPGRGSRGGSPGQYVMRYMAREDATEVLAPVRLLDNVGFGVGSIGYDSAEFTRYMTRSDATELLKSKKDELLQDADAYGSPSVLKHRFRTTEKQAGRAFGSSGISLSHQDLVGSSEAIQEAFDNGHSVQKIVLSFTEDYLRETGVLDPTFKYKGRGSYKGHIDQLKLRHAITAGVDDMTKVGRFVDPEWVGTVQVDTGHVHAHIALVDKSFSEFRMRGDGADRGKINEREKYMFRRGLNFSLEDMKDLRSFHKQSSLERQSVVAFVKDYAYATLYENTSVQLLIASLPKEKHHWRHGTNRKSMSRANELATGVVERVFREEPDASGYNRAMKAVHDYADESEERNRLTPDKKQEVITNGRNRIIERSVNGLYGTLKELDPSLLNTRTSMIDIQSSSDEQLMRALKSDVGSSDATPDFDPAAFELRVRGYNKRREIHKEDATEYFNLAEEFDTAFESGYVDDTAHVMRLFYEEEMRYHMALTDKYRSFLSFNHPKDRENVEVMRPVYDDLVERYADIQQREIDTGSELTIERDDYKRDLRGYTYECFDKSVGSLKEWEAIVDYDVDSLTGVGRATTNFVLPVRPKTGLENLNGDYFNRVKAYDVHHLGLDYYNKPDTRIDSTNAVNFATIYESRAARADAAQVYIQTTGQSLHALDRAVVDIIEMETVVDKALDSGLIHTVELDDLTITEERQLFTIPLDHSVDVADKVRISLEHVDINEPNELE